MTSWPGHAFAIAGSLWLEFIGHQWIPDTKTGNSEHWCFLCCCVSLEILKLQYFPKLDYSVQITDFNCWTLMYLGIIFTHVFKQKYHILTNTVCQLGSSCIVMITSYKRLTQPLLCHRCTTLYTIKMYCWSVGHFRKHVSKNINLTIRQCFIMMKILQFRSFWSGRSELFNGEMNMKIWASWDPNQVSKRRPEKSKKEGNIHGNMRLLKKL